MAIACEWPINKVETSVETQIINTARLDSRQEYVLKGQINSE